MRKKILLVEDEKVLIKMYAITFEKAGFEMKNTDNVKDALEIMKTWKPDVVLLDILLAGANGLQLLKDIKNEPTLLSTPVLVFSNYTDVNTEKEAMQLGAKAYIIKTDYDPEDAVEVIKKYIG